MAVPEDFFLGAVQGIFVGDYGSLAVLTQLAATPTQGGRFRYGVEKKWENADQDDHYIEEASLTCELNFYWDQYIYRLSMTTSLSTTNLDDAPAGKQYTVLILSGNTDSASKSSILIPQCCSKCLIDEPHLKLEGTAIPLLFHFKNRNTYVQLHRRGSYATLAGLLGSRSPI